MIIYLSGKVIQNAKTTTKVNIRFANIKGNKIYVKIDECKKEYVQYKMAILFIKKVLPFYLKLYII